MNPEHHGELDAYNPDDCIRLTIHSEHGRTPQRLTVIIPDVITPGDFLDDYVREYYDRCTVNGTFEAISWLFNQGLVCTPHTPDDVLEYFDPQYIYVLTAYPEAAINGGADVELTINNRVDEPQTFNLDAITTETAASLA